MSGVGAEELKELKGLAGMGHIGTGIMARRVKVRDGKTRGNKPQ